MPGVNDDKMTLLGVRADGSQVVVGEITTSPKRKAREFVEGIMGRIDEDAGNDAAMALWACEQLIDWMGETKHTINMVRRLSDERIKEIAKAMPDGEGGILRSWGYQQFAHALMDDLGAPLEIDPPAAPPKPAAEEPSPVSGVSLRDYFVAHAPATPQTWFRPNVQSFDVPVLQPPCDLTESELAEIRDLGMFAHPSQYQLPRTRAFAEQTWQWVRAKEARDVEYSRELHQQWPGAWADEQLRLRAGRPTTVQAGPSAGSLAGATPTLDWLLKSADTGQQLVMVGSPEERAGASRIHLTNTVGSPKEDWTLVVRVTRGWLTDDERAANLVKAVAEMQAEPTELERQQHEAIQALLKGSVFKSIDNGEPDWHSIAMPHRDSLELARHATDAYVTEYGSLAVEAAAEALGIEVSAPAVEDRRNWIARQAASGKKLDSEAMPVHSDMLYVMGHDSEGRLSCCRTTKTHDPGLHLGIMGRAIDAWIAISERGAKYSPEAVYQFIFGVEYAGGDSSVGGDPVLPVDRAGLVEQAKRAVNDLARRSIYGTWTDEQRQYINALIDRIAGSAGGARA